MKISNILQKLVPTDLKFFEMFEQLSAYIKHAAEAQHQIFDHDDPVKQKDLFKKISELEKSADEVSDAIFAKLDKSFVPPFDREDIHKLTTSMDFVIDLINGVSQQVKLYRPKEIPAGYNDFSKLVSKACEQMDTAVLELRELKKPGKILKACQKIQQLEKDSDDLYHSLISGIFKREKDAIELIKQKEILENLEKIADAVKAVSDTIKTIILKMA